MVLPDFNAALLRVHRRRMLHPLWGTRRASVGHVNACDNGARPKGLTIMKKLYAVLPFIALLCGCAGEHTVRVVESVDRTRLVERYTIPATHVTGWYGPITEGAAIDYWTEPEVVHYEKWKITAKDGFEIELERVDPKSQPEITPGQRYEGEWK